jgi:hypothetical protein
MQNQSASCANIFPASTFYRIWKHISFIKVVLSKQNIKYISISISKKYIVIKPWPKKQKNDLKLNHQVNRQLNRQLTLLRSTRVPRRKGHQWRQRVHRNVPVSALASFV